MEKGVAGTNRGKVAESKRLSVLHMLELYSARGVCLEKLETLYEPKIGNYYVNDP